MRGFLVTVLLAVALAAGTAYYFDLIDPAVIFGPGAETTGPAAPAGDGLPLAELGGPLYPPSGADLNPDARPQATSRPEPIVIPNCPLVVYKKQEVPAKREGQVIIIGKPLQSEEPLTPRKNRQARIILGVEKELLMPYLPWEELNIVSPGEIVAVVDPALAIKEYDKSKNKLNIAEKEHEVAVKISAEMLERWKRFQRAEARAPGSVAAEEMNIAKLTWEAKVADSETKQQAIELARTEVDMAKIVYEEHYLRNKLAGKARIKQILKSQGEAVQRGETVMILEDIENLRAEGRMDPQYMFRLREYEALGKKMSVTIEPRVEQAPWRPLKAHREEVTGVAVSQDGLIVSVSRDRTVNVWTLSHRSPIRMFEMDTEVLSVACTPKAAAGNWCVVGCEDGGLSLWDLNDADSKPKWAKPQAHQDGITALAFSPDGAYLASGGEDNIIRVWDAATGEPKYTVAGHQGVVTSLNFTPQARLVSASRDGTLRVWALHEKGARELSAVPGRTGAVSQLDVTSDGRTMLFDNGRELQLLSVPDGRTQNYLTNVTAATSFETLARLSPDGRLLLTAGAPEGRLQLWRTPTDTERGFEVAQFAALDRSPVTCAAFAPAGLRLGEDDKAAASFAVSGSKGGYIHIWAVPSAAAAEGQRLRGLRLDQMHYELEVGRQVRIGVNVANPDGRLVPGGTVTVVIEEE